MASDIYRSAMAYYEANERDGGALQHRVWDGTPWIANVYEGGHESMRYRDMILWCTDKWGKQAWWGADRSGEWQRGNATVNGWTWWGFDTEAKMREFIAAWPSPEGASSQPATGQ